MVEREIAVGQRIIFLRHGHSFGPDIHGYVTKLTGDPDAPAKVRNNGRTYIPRREDYVEPKLQIPPEC